MQYLMHLGSFGTENNKLQAKGKVKPSCITLPWDPSSANLPGFLMRRRRQWIWIHS
jgi:hypothetical protein